MTKKTRDRIAKLAQRLLFAQLEADPKAKTDIEFSFGEWRCRIDWNTTSPDRWAVRAVAPGRVLRDMHRYREIEI